MRLVRSADANDRPLIWRHLPAATSGIEICAASISTGSADHPDLRLELEALSAKSPVHPKALCAVALFQSGDYRTSRYSKFDETANPVLEHVLT